MFADTMKIRAARAPEIHVEPDIGGFADDILLRDEPPVAAVVTVVAVVPDHQIVTGGHDHLLVIAVITLAGHFGLDTLIVAFHLARAAGRRRYHDLLGGLAREHLVLMMLQDFGIEAKVVVT